MLHNKTFTRTKGTRGFKIVREHYLRDDIYCGSPLCKVCDTSSARLSSSPSTILIIDTNVALHHIGLLENLAIDNVVLLSIVLEEVKNKNLAVYNQLRKLCTHPDRKFYYFANEHHRDTYVERMAGESPNDRNDRGNRDTYVERMVIAECSNDIAIRVESSWYQRHLGGKVQILLLTNDRENKIKNIGESFSAATVETYVRSLAKPESLELVPVPTSGDANMEEVEDMRPSKRKLAYSEHKPMSEITSGLLRGIYHQGKIRVNRYNPFEAYVGSESIVDEIVISGRINMNRAFDCDIVAVEILSHEQWHEGKSSIAADDEDEEDEDVHLVPSSADDAPRNTNLEGVPGALKSVSSRPCGRVVGVIKRNWHS